MPESVPVAVVVLTEPLITSGLGPLLAQGDWKIAIPQRFVSFIDFRARDKERIEARTRLGWWAILVDNATTPNMYEAKSLKTLEDMTDWAIKTVAPTFAAIYQGTGQSMTEISNFMKMEWNE